MTGDEGHRQLSRRQWLAAAPLGAAAAIASAEGAHAKVDGVVPAPPLPDGFASADWPYPAAIASPRLPGYTYLTAMGHDFFPFNSERIFSSDGYYASGGLLCTFDVPAGALLRDCEFYAYNSSGFTRTAGITSWTADNAPSFSIASTTIPSQSAIISARATVPEALRGPYPTGVKFGAFFASTSASFQANGARLGLTNGGGHLGLRSEPLKVFDTTEAGSGGKLAANETRLITLAASRVPEGCVGALFRIAVSGATGGGRLKLYGANLESPDFHALAFASGLDAVGEVTVAVPLNRKLKISATRAVHVRLHVVATIG